MIRSHHRILRTIAILFVVCSFVGFAQAFNTVIIDAGHGGHDLGASNSLVYEKHINLDVARRLEIALRRAGYKVVMTRTRDEEATASLRPRASTKSSAS